MFVVVRQCLNLHIYILFSFVCAHEKKMNIQNDSMVTKYFVFFFHVILIYSLSSNYLIEYFLLLLEPYYSKGTVLLSKIFCYPTQLFSR